MLAIRTLALFAFSWALAAQNSFTWLGNSGSFNAAGSWIQQSFVGPIPAQNAPTLSDQAGISGFSGLITADGGTAGTLSISNDNNLINLNIQGGLTLGNGGLNVSGGTLNIIGAGTIQSAGNLLFGIANDGSNISVAAGVSIIAPQGAITVYPGSTGNFVVGAGSVWDVAQINASNSQMTIQNGGTVQSSNLTTGRVSVTTLMVDAGSLSTGSLEAGTLNIAGGGTVTTYVSANLTGALYPVSASVNTVTVDGTGSQFINMGGASGTITLTNGALADDSGGHNGTGATYGAIYVHTGSTFYTGNMNGSGVVDGGSTIVSRVLNLGFVNGNANTSMVSGAGSSWTAQSGVIGTPLRIQDGGTFSTTDSTNSLALTSYTYAGGPAAAVTVDGAGSTLNVAGTLTIGYAPQASGPGSGTVTVQNGGSLVVGQDLQVGAGIQGYGNGELTLDGAQSSLQVNHGTIYAGFSGTGVITAQNGFNYSDMGRNIVVGAALGSNGTLNVTGPNTSLTVETVTVGRDHGSYGTVNITAGGSLSTTQDMVVASNGGGTALVGGMGSTLHVGGDLTIGDTGVGTMTLQNAAEASVDGSLTLGSQANGQGTLAVTGMNTTFNGGTGDTLIGDAGQGTLTISAGGTFDAPLSDMTIANQANAAAGTNPSGMVTVSGQDSALNVQSLTVGGAGNGQLLVNQGASVTTGDMTVGESAGSMGTATITDSGTSLSVNGDLVVGSAGKGTLSVQGADLSVSGNITVGEQGGGNGLLTINATNVDFSGTLTAGENGKGTVTFGQGASATMDAIKLGQNPGSSGTLNINDPGTVIQSNDLTVGSMGKGMLNVSNNGRLNTLTDANIGDAIEGFTSTATVQTGGVWAINGDLSVGSKGFASLTVETAGQVVDLGSVKIGDETSAGGTVTVNGVQGNMASTLTYGQQLIVGNNGGGVLNIQAGGLVGSQPNGPGTVEVAAGAGSHGSITVDGQGSLLEATTLSVGGTMTAQGGNGSITLTNNGAIDVASALKIWTGNTVNVTGGSLTLGSSVSQAATGTLQINTGGTLSGGGTIRGTVVNNGGTISPGDPASLQINGNYVQQSGALDLLIEGTGAGEYDQMIVTGGSADFQGGSIILDFEGGFAPSAGDVFDLIAADQGVSLESDMIFIEGLAPGFEYSVEYDSSSGTFGIDALNNGASNSAAPEPSTLFLSAAAIVLAVLVKNSVTRKTANA